MRKSIFADVLKNRLAQLLCRDVEGIIPDLVGGAEKFDPVEDRDSIRDYVADQASDRFPSWTAAERNTAVDYIVNYHCGTDGSANDETFRIEDLRRTL